MKTLVIVEDEFRIRDGLSRLINRLSMGVSVIGEAANGFEGLKCIQDLNPDVVITDIKMPKMSGLEMIRQAKHMALPCRFVILSGYAEFSYAQQAISLGVTDYLLKPTTISDVRELLEKINPKEKPPTDDKQMGNQYSELVSAIIDTVTKSYASHLSLTDLADTYKVTPQYISTVFAKETGMTFSNYIRKIRIEEAKKLLLETDMRVYEIAVAVGYPDQKYFSKVFKEYTGVSAKQYALKHGRKDME